MWGLKRAVEIIASDMHEKGNGFKAIFIVSVRKRVSTIKINQPSLCSKCFFSAQSMEHFLTWVIFKPTIDYFLNPLSVVAPTVHAYSIGAEIPCFTILYMINDEDKNPP